MQETRFSHMRRSQGTELVSQMTYARETVPLMGICQVQCTIQHTRCPAFIGSYFVFSLACHNFDGSRDCLFPVQEVLKHRQDARDFNARSLYMYEFLNRKEITYIPILCTLTNHDYVFYLQLHNTK